LPVGRFAQDNLVTRARRFEAHGAFYQRYLRIRCWKDRLPEAGAFFTGGFSKRRLIGRSEEHLNRFVAETRRAELVHWTNLCAGPVFFIWCGPLIGSLMVLFGVGAHLPFIAVQRFNRERLRQVLARSARQQTSTR
jgi:glycosyl-4,4'-diaponeurosporenoate acyltransferase